MVIGVIVTGLVALLRWGWVPPNISNASCRLTDNGAWISIDWTSQAVDETAVAQLAESASIRQIQYLFPFTTYLKSDGTFSQSYTFATEFITQFRRYNQETLLLAWVGIPLQNDRHTGIEGWVDLADKSTRDEIVTFVAKLVKETDFDGVHLNVETVRNNNPDYLLLLDELRAAMDSRHILSVASSYWMPAALNKLPLVDGFKWSAGYYQAVANRVDQLATMTYDSVMPHPALYRLWLREQVREINKSLVGSDVDLLIGISISREHTTTHDPNAENMHNGLAGICASLSELEAEHIVDGVSIYASWEADTTDWQTWENWITASPHENR